MTDFPEELISSLKEGKLIPFVGAGVSKAVTDHSGKPLFPNWDDLLRNTLSQIRKKKPGYSNLVDGFLKISPPDYLQAAKYAKQGLGENEWHKHLKSQFDIRQGKANQESLGLAKAIWELNCKLIVTTNYDSVLRWACPHQGDYSLLTNDAAVEQAEILKNNLESPTTWHLHGHINNKANLILTPDGYRCLYPDEKNSEDKYQSALQTLQNLMVSHTFLFIGFSLDDPYFGVQLKWINEIYKGAMEHFVLLHEKDLANFQSNELPVRPVTFKDYGEPLIEMVLQLAQFNQPKPPENDLQGLDKTPEITLSSPSPDSPGASFSSSNSYFNVPFRAKGEAVIGRAETLEKIRHQLTSGKKTSRGNTAAFRGIGGLGKTQFAVEYAHQYKDDYPEGVIWLNADQDLDAQLTGIAVKAKWISPNSEHHIKLDVARQRLRSFSNCLIIFDNVEEVSGIQDYLPLPEATPHLLITSHKEIPGFVHVPLEILDKEQSLKLLYLEASRQPTDEKEKEAAEKIAELLNGLPLALELAGAYLNVRDTVTWGQYQSLLERNLPKALPKEIDSFTDHNADLFSTLKISENELEQEPRLIEILDLLTWSGNSYMGLPLMCSLIGADDSAELIGALSLGESLKLLERHPDQDRYSLHRLVRTVRQQEFSIEKRKDWASNLSINIGNWFENDREQFNNLEQFEAEFDHLKAWERNAEKLDLDSEVRLIWLCGYPSYHRGHYQEAEEHVQRSYSKFIERKINDPLLEAHLLNDLGATSGLTANHQEGLDYYQKALEIRINNLGENDLDTATSLNNVGCSLGNTGELIKQNQGLEYLYKALAIRQEKLGDTHSQTADSYNNIASALGELGKHQESFKFHNKALDIKRGSLGEYHPDTATALNNVGFSYSELGQHQKALEYTKKALVIRTEQLGEHHPDTANSFTCIAYALGGLSKYSEALKFYNKALDILQDRLGASHPDVALCLNNIGSTYGLRGEHQKKIEYCNKALAIRTEQLGEINPDTVGSIFSISTALISLDKKEEALNLLQTTLNKLPKNHERFSQLKNRTNNLKSKAINPGFRQPSTKQKKRKR